MKNVNLPNSSNSVSSDYDDYSSSIRRIMVPIRELDFESRVMFNARLPKKKPFSEQLRKNDFVVDLKNYKGMYAGANSSHNQHLLKTLRHCFNQEENNSESISYNLNEMECSDLTMNGHSHKISNECKIESDNSLGNSVGKSSEKISAKFSPSGSRHHQILSADSIAKSGNTDSMMMTTTLSPDCKTATTTFTKLNINSINNKSVKNTNSNLDRKCQHESANHFNSPNEQFNENQDFLPNQDIVDQNESLLGQQKKKSTRTSTFDEANNQNKLKLNNRIMNATKSRNYKYRIWQCKIYNYLERPRGWKSGLYHILIFATVFLCLILSVLATIPQYEETASNVLMQTEMIIVVWLSVELTLRVWSAGCRSRYQTWKGRLKFMGNIFCILDLTVIVASITLTVIASSQNKHKNFAAAAFRGLRFFQILRMLRVDRRAGTWRLLGTVVWAHRQELITTFYIGFLSLISSSFVMYLLEKDAADTKINTFADSLWWGVITLCTIGYGDVYPVTWAGKVLASSVALIGISFFALPAGILGSGFALKVQAMQRQKHLNRRRAPAARLIQCLWRCYAADPNSMSVATWKIHQKALANQHQSILPTLSQPPNIPEYSIANLAKPYIGNNSFLNRVTSLKRRTPPLSSEKPFNENKSYIKTNSLVQLPYSGNNVEILQTRRDAIVIPGLFNSQTSVYTYNAPNSQVSSPSPETLNAESDSPINDFQQPGNRSNSSFVNALQQVSSRSHNEQTKVAPIKSSLAHRTLNFFSEFNSNYKSENDELLGVDNQLVSHSNRQNNKPPLSNQQKNAIRAVRKINYFVARRKFKEALRPYDVTDVIEQYSAGNLDMLARIKTLQFRLDKILGSTKSKDCYDSCSVSLASRVVKIERQMEDIGSKFDKFLTAYTVDMKTLMKNSGKSFLQQEKLLFRTSSYEPGAINDKKNCDRRARQILLRSKDKERSRADENFVPSKWQSTDDDDDDNDVYFDEDRTRLRKLRQQQEIISKQINDTLQTLRKNKIIFDKLESNNDESFWYDDSMGHKVFFDPKIEKSNFRHHDTKHLAENIDRLYKLSKSDKSKNISKKVKKLKSMMKKYLLDSIKDKSLGNSQFKIKKFKSDPQLNRVANHQKRSSLNFIKLNVNPIELNGENVKKKVQISQNLYLIEPNTTFQASVVDENECDAKNTNKLTSSKNSLGEKESKSV